MARGGTQHDGDGGEGLDAEVRNKLFVHGGRSLLWESAMKLSAVTEGAMNIQSLT